MKIVCYDFGGQVKEPLEMLYAFRERAERLQVLQVAYVMADESEFLMRQAESIFQLRAAGQYLVSRI